VESNVDVGVFAQCSEGGELRIHRTGARNLAISESGACSVASRAADAFEGAHTCTMLDNLPLGCAHDEDAAAGHRAQKPSCSRMESASRRACDVRLDAARYLV